MYFDQTIRFNEDQTDSVEAIEMNMPPHVAHLPSPTSSRHKRSFSFTSASSGKK